MQGTDKKKFVANFLSNRDFAVRRLPILVVNAEELERVGLQQPRLQMIDELLPLLLGFVEIVIGFFKFRHFRSERLHFQQQT